MESIDPNLLILVLSALSGLVGAALPFVMFFRILSEEWPASSPSKKALILMGGVIGVPLFCMIFVPVFAFLFWIVLPALALFGICWLLVKVFSREG